ncbi:MAG: hypothetical protein ACR2LC_14745 [Pyrinomonadaceae bacterium]
MQAKHLIASTALSLLVCSSNAFAQMPVPTSTPAPTEQQKQAQKEVEKKALALLEDTIADAQSLRVPENRALVTATAADLLWTRDEKRARSLFTDALNALAAARTASSGANNAEDGEGAGRNYANYAGYMASALRQQLLQMVARHDATLALDLLRAGSSVKQAPASDASKVAAPAQANQNRGMMDEDARLEQTLIAQIAATDPKTALRIAEESLAKGVSPNLLSTLRVLQRKDAEAATKLAGSIVERLHNTNFQTNPEAAFVVMQLFDISAHPERYGSRQAATGDTAAATAEAAKKPQSLLSETASRDLADIAASALLNKGVTGGILYQDTALLPFIEKYAPARAPQIRRKLADIKKTIDPQEQALMKYQEQFQSGTIDGMLQAASEAPASVRAALYQSAAWKALSQNDTTRARQIIQDKITDTQERAQLLTQIDRQALTQALRLGKLDEARQMLRERGTRSKKDQAMMLAMLAQVAAKKGDRKFALDVLDEARQLVPNSQAQNQDQIDAQLAVAAAYTFVEPARSFEIIEPMIDQANELIRAAALLDKFGNSGQRFFRNGELMLSMSGGASFAIRSRYGRALTLLANADFDRARAAADRFQQPELRVMARLLIAQGALDTAAPQSTLPPSELDFMPGEMNSFGGGTMVIGNQ